MNNFFVLFLVIYNTLYSMPQGEYAFKVNLLSSCVFLVKQDDRNLKIKSHVKHLSSRQTSV